MLTLYLKSADEVHGFEEICMSSWVADHPIGVFRSSMIEINHQSKTAHDISSYHELVRVFRYDCKHDLKDGSDFTMS